MCVISAFSVETNTNGFAVCSWPATSQKEAQDKARDLSLDKMGDARYPNPFWVMDGEGKALVRYFHGKRYECSGTI
jgi:hypothetical protein